MRPRLAGLTALTLAAVLTLSACESSEERAQRHFETGMALLEEGDVARALVEFRNVFKLNPRHKDARLAYARTQMENGNRAEAYGQFLRLVEQYPETVEARVELAEMAIHGRNWDEAERHGEAAIEIDPENPRIKVIATALAYAKAVRSEDSDARAKLADDAESELQEQPENYIARQMVIDYLVSTGKPQEAIPIIEAGLEQQPENYELHRIRLATQVKNEDKEGIGKTLRQMVETFPDDEESRRLLITWYIQQGEMDQAEAFLRELAERPDAEDGTHLAVVQLLSHSKGEDAARAELQSLIESQEDPTRYVAILASMDFDAGNREQAITTLQELVDSADAEKVSDEMNASRVLLARMLQANGNHVGARSLIEEVLAEDASNVEALKMRAGWHIQDDKPGEAIIDLRNALAQAPRDPDIMTLMAAAHERAGDRALAGERYALAVELSEKAPTESLRYARFLSGDERPEAATAVLTEALEVSPRNVALLQAVGTLYVDNKDWNEVQRVIWKLRAIETPEATNAANAIEAEMLLQQDRLDDTISFLKDLSENSDDGRALMALLQTQIQAGETEEAVLVIEERLAEKPDDPVLRFLRAGLHVVENEREAAETLYSGLLEELPANDIVIRTLYSLLLAEGRIDDARALIEEQITLNPKALNVRLLKAEMLERSRDFEGAIAIYEELYTENSNNIIVANNLASLISAHRDDDESLERAYAVARRLRGMEIPALQDTYGWIEYRRGNFDEAVVHLEPAAAGLTTDPLVQYHLGRTYMALERFAEARAQFEKAIKLSGDNPLPQITEAKQLLAKLPEGNSVENGGGATE